MPRLTRIYTRTGDDGTTALTGGGRVSKASPRVEAYGTVDELNSIIGRALASGCVAEVRLVLASIQNTLFHLGAELSRPQEAAESTPSPSLENRHLDEMEQWIDDFTGELGALENFVLPGGCASAADLHVARTVCRRAERLVVALSQREAIGEWTVRYLNRLSDLLFTLARVENKSAGVADVLWDSRA